MKISEIEEILMSYRWMIEEYGVDSYIQTVLNEIRKKSQNSSS